MTDSHFVKNSREPRWQCYMPFSTVSASTEQLDWLLDPSSLTRRLQLTCRGQFRVVPVSQRWQRPQLNEAQALNVRPHERCFIREVHLLCEDRPWVFARTVIPVRTLTGSRRRLTRLGRKPLGAILFADPAMRRSHIEIAHIKPESVLFESAVVSLGTPLAEKPLGIWGRRSAFFLGNKPLLVSEFFLPEIGYGGCEYKHND